jgi:reactive intermediate/imine deaminase
MAGDIERIATAEAPQPAGHYAQGTAWDGLIFVSGQLATRPDGTRLNDRPFAEQARQALANMLAIARAGGADPADFLKVTVYIVGIAHWPEFNAVFAEVFGAALPARAVVPVPELHHGFLVEVEGVAVRRSI